MRRIVPICCFCEKVRDDSGTESGRGPWQEFTFFMAAYMLGPDEVMFSHTYCPDCLLLYRGVLASPKNALNRNDTGGELDGAVTSA